jgi:predicted transcriptional regulator
MRESLTISLPKEMRQQVNEACRREHRTKSELMREALRVYFRSGRTAATIPSYTPTKAELRAIEKGRAAMRRGEYMTLDEFRDWLMGSPGRTARAKGTPTRARARARTTRRRA